MENQREPTPEDVFGRRIKAEREARGWTQAELTRRAAEHLGSDPYSSLVAKIESRDVASPRLIRLDEASAFAKVFGLPLDALLASSSGYTEAQAALQHTQNAAGDLSDATRELWGRLTTYARHWRDTPEKQSEARVLAELLARVADQVQGVHNALSEHLAALTTRLPETHPEEGNA